MAVFALDSVRPEDLIAKAGCYLCGTDHATDDGPLVDLDMWIEGEGRIVLCARCVRTIAAVLGFVTPEELKAVVETNIKLKAELKGAKMRIGKQTKALDAIGLLRQDASTDSAKMGMKGKISVSA